MTAAEREAAELAEGLAKAGSQRPPALPTAPTDPAPARDLAESAANAARKHAAQQATPAPDPELVELGKLARATCGCVTCGTGVKRVGGGVQRSGIDRGKPATCLAGEMLRLLREEARAKP